MSRRAVVMLILAMAALLPASAFAQRPNFELDCPGGYIPVNAPGQVTVNNTTGLFRQQTCIDATGNILKIDLTRSSPIAANDGPNPNYVTLDWRGTTIPSNTTLGKTIAYNVTTGGGTDSMVREQMTVSSIPLGTGAVLTHYFLTSLNGTGSAGTVDGISSEAQVTGALSGTLGNLQGNEAVATATSTGGTVNTAAGVIGYVFSTIGSTTAIINAYGLRGLGCNNTILGAAPTNCYGAFFDTQTPGGVGVASSRNYSFGAGGPGLLLFDSGPSRGGLDCEDASHITHNCFWIAGTNDLNVQALTSAGLNLDDSTGTPQASVTSGGFTLKAVAFASLGTPINGTLRYCNDCTIANPCAGGGTGALAKRINGAWVCN